MSNPFSIQALATLPQGPGQATDNITGKASSGAKFALGLGAVDQHGTLRYDNNVGPIKAKTNATATTGNKVLTFYLITSEDGSVWTDGIDPNSTSDQSSKISQATVVGVITGIAASTTYVLPEFSVADVLGFVPQYWAVVYQLDVTAGGFSATASDHQAKYAEIQYA